MRYRKPNKKKPIIILGAVGLMVLAGIVLCLELGGVTNFYERKPSDSSATQDEINLGPPTEEEQQSADEQKDKTLEEEKNRNNPDQAPDKTANVIITDATQYDNIVEVRSFVNNHYEDGTCTITFTKSGQTVSKDTPAYRDVSTTICTNPLFPKSDFPSDGDWQLVVSYKSANANGQSNPQTVTIK